LSVKVARQDVESTLHSVLNSRFLRWKSEWNPGASVPVWLIDIKEAGHRNSSVVWDPEISPTGSRILVSPDRFDPPHGDCRRFADAVVRAGRAPGFSGVRGPECRPRIFWLSLFWLLARSMGICAAMEFAPPSGGVPSWSAACPRCGRRDGRPTGSDTGADNGVTTSNDLSTARTAVRSGRASRWGGRPRPGCPELRRSSPVGPVTGPRTGPGRGRENAPVGALFFAGPCCAGDLRSGLSLVIPSERATRSLGVKVVQFGQNVA
jgi:hypothetical protein